MTGRIQPAATILGRKKSDPPDVRRSEKPRNIKSKSPNTLNRRNTVNGVECHPAKHVPGFEVLQIQIVGEGGFVHDDAVAFGGVFAEQLVEHRVRFDEVFDIHP